MAPSADKTAVASTAEAAAAPADAAEKIEASESEESRSRSSDSTTSSTTSSGKNMARGNNAVLSNPAMATSTSTPAGKAADAAKEAPAKTNGEEEEDSALAKAKARAVAEAAAEADSTYVPSQSVLNATTAAPLLSQIDGPALSTYQTSDNIYVARNIPVALRAKLDVPIHVSVAGSVVEYEVKTTDYDIMFGITADREDTGSVSVKTLDKVDSHLSPITGKFLVGSVPCALVFTFDNTYSWFREKSVTYQIKVTPPGIENVMLGRRRRAQCALGVVEDDKKSAEARLRRATTQRSSLQDIVHKLEKELAESKKSLDVVEKEAKWLTSRLEVRGEQIDELQSRLNDGWDDEKDLADSGKSGNEEDEDDDDDGEENRNEDGKHEF